MESKDPLSPRANSNHPDPGKVVTKIINGSFAGLVLAGILALAPATAFSHGGGGFGGGGGHGGGFGRCCQTGQVQQVNFIARRTELRAHCSG